MADALFYMRVRGKISGPFDIATLQKAGKARDAFSDSRDIE